MIAINKNLCTGCGACVADCFKGEIVMKDNKAEPTNTACFECGHCVAVCPANTIELKNHDMGEVLEYDEKNFHLEPDNLLNFIKFRRSVRRFTDRKVEREKIERIIEAGRYTPTASNRQQVSYIVVQDEIPALLTLALESLNEIAANFLKEPEKLNPTIKNYCLRWQAMYKKHLEAPHQPTDLFFNAGTILLVISDSEIDGGLAASNMGLMANAEGLGLFYSGFFRRAAASSEKIRTFLNLAPSQQVTACLVMGYPGVKYRRTAPRKKATIAWR